MNLTVPPSEPEPYRVPCGPLEDFDALEVLEAQVYE